MFPRAVITDRSAMTGGPAGGLLYLAYDGRGREAELRGVTVLARPGAGPLDGDIARPGGLCQAGKGRALAANARPSRSRNGRTRRTLDPAELGDWIDRLGQVDGAQRLAQYREQAEHIADAVGAPREGDKEAVADDRSSPRHSAGSCAVPLCGPGPGRAPSLPRERRCPLAIELSVAAACRLSAAGSCHPGTATLWGSKTGHRLLTCGFYCRVGGATGSIAGL
jgi:hypothetical protein